MDAGVAKFAGATQERRLQTWFLNELGSQFSYAGQMRPDVFFYATNRGSRIDFIIESKDTRYAVKLTESEAPGTYLLRATEAFRKKHPRIPVWVLAPCLHILQPGSDKDVKIAPWSSIV